MRLCFGTTEFNLKDSQCNCCKMFEKCKVVEPKSVKKKKIVVVPHKKKEKKEKVLVHQIDKNGEVIVDKDKKTKNVD